MTETPRARPLDGWSRDQIAAMLHRLWDLPWALLPPGLSQSDRRELVDAVRERYALTLHTYRPETIGAHGRPVALESWASHVGRGVIRRRLGARQMLSIDALKRQIRAAENDPQVDRAEMIVGILMAYLPSTSSASCLGRVRARELLLQLTRSPVIEGAARSMGVSIRAAKGTVTLLRRSLPPKLLETLRLFLDRPAE